MMDEGNRKKKILKTGDVNMKNVMFVREDAMNVIAGLTGYIFVMRRIAGFVRIAGSLKYLINEYKSYDSPQIFLKGGEKKLDSGHYCMDVVKKINT